MSTKHTPGPWFTKREGFSTVYVEARIGGGWIQEIAACGPTEEGQLQQEANARLIAAAPELLEDARASMAVIVTHKCPSCGIDWSDDECKQMMDEKSASCICGYRHNFDGAAIAKATGGAA